MHQYVLIEKYTSMQTSLVIADETQKSVHDIAIIFVLSGNNRDPFWQ